MTPTTWRVLTLATALACAASGGAFLTFSTLTTAGLARLSASQGMAAMQQINVAAPRSPLFMALLFVPALAGCGLAVAGLALHLPGRGLLLAGAVVYTLGVALMTIAFHVPRNDALAALDPQTQAAGFPQWLHVWVVGNHVRTVAGLVAGSLLAAAATRP